MKVFDDYLGVNATTRAKAMFEARLRKKLYKKGIAAFNAHTVAKSLDTKDIKGSSRAVLKKIAGLHKIS